MVDCAHDEHEWISVEENKWVCVRCGTYGCKDESGLIYIEPSGPLILSTEDWGFIDFALGDLWSRQERSSPLFKKLMDLRSRIGQEGKEAAERGVITNE